MKLSSVIKLTVTALMLFIIFRSTKIDKVQEVLGRISLIELGTVTAIYLSAQLLSSVKWWLLATAAGVPSSFYTADGGGKPNQEKHKRGRKVKGTKN